MNAWKRLRKCSICGHNGFCTISGDGEVVKCMRTPSPRPIKHTDGSVGYLHPTPTGEAARAKSLPSSKDVPRLTIPAVKALMKQHRSAINPMRLKRLSESLGVSERALKAFGIGWDTTTGCWSFPMYDGEIRPIGLRLRRDDGRKLCVPGSRNGLFIPENYAPVAIPDGVFADGSTAPWLLVMPEGPTDAAAAFDIGFNAIGRPNNCGGADLIRKLLSTGCKQEVIVVADHDETKWRDVIDMKTHITSQEAYWPGIEGALSLCEQILPACGTLQFALPPDDAKDLRKWVQTNGVGAWRKNGLEGTIVTRAWIAAARERLEKKRRTALWERARTQRKAG